MIRLAELARRRRSGERGVAIIEAAIVLPLVVLIFLSAVEFGFAWRDVNRIERGLQSAARTASSIGRGRFADFEAIRAVDSALEGMSGATLERVIIFRASSADGTVPAACRAVANTATQLTSHGVSGSCNVYSPAQVATQTPVGFGGTSSGTCSGGSWDSNWCPSTRDDSAPDLTYLGVYIRATYKPFTSVITGPTLTIERTTVYRVEPCVPTIQTCT